MLVISNKQYRTLSQMPKDRFREFMMNHLNDQYPVHSQLHTAGSLAALMDIWVEKCKKYGFTSPYEQCLFMDIMVMLGDGIDTDPLLPGISQLLNAQQDMDTKAKVDACFRIASDYLDNLIGKKEVFPVRQLRKMMNFPKIELSGYFTGRDDHEILSALRHLWPRKYSIAGAANMNNFIELSSKNANVYGLRDRVSVRYFIFLAFVFGHRVHADPFYPWVGEVLNDKNLYTEAGKYNALYEVVKEKLEAGMADEPFVL